VARFLLDVWRSRADDKRRRVASARGTETDARNARDHKAIDSIAIIVDWCTNKGLAVVFDSKRLGGYDPNTKQVRCNSRHRPEAQLFLLLHECGHFLIGDKGHEKFSLVEEAENDPNVKRMLAHRVDVISEELEAWNRGRSLARRLKIRIKKREWDRFRARCLKGYIKWALRPGDFE
jgi:Zn-dependent peptidase ImmA (M78 family)